MKKFKIEEIEQVLVEVDDIADDARKKTIEILKNLSEEEKEEKEPKAKKQYVVLVIDNEGNLDLSSNQCLVFQVNPEDDKSGFVSDLIESCRSFNNSKKGKKNPVKKISEIVEGVPARFFVDNDLWLKSKELVTIFTLPNEIEH